MGRYHKAIDDYTEAIAFIDNSITTNLERKSVIRRESGFSRNLAQAYRQRGNAYRETKQYQQALADFSKSNFIEPLPIDFYLYRAEVYREIADYQQALNDYVMVIACDDDSADRAIAHLGMRYIYRDRQKLSEAIDSFNRAADLFMGQGKREEFDATVNEIEKLQ